MFGLFLVERGLVSEKSLLEALTQQVRQTTPIGKLAIEHRIMSVREVMDTLASQAVGRPRRFGSIAIELGHLTREQLERLLRLQKELRPKLGEIIVENGWLTEAEVKEELGAYLRTRT